MWKDVSRDDVGWMSPLVSDVVREDCWTIIEMAWAAYVPLDALPSGFTYDVAGWPQDCLSEVGKRLHVDESKPERISIENVLVPIGWMPVIAFDEGHLVDARDYFRDPATWDDLFEDDEAVTMEVIDCGVDICGGCF